MTPSSSSLTWFGTALLLELHGHDPPLHRHPISHDTYGEPPDLSLLAVGLYHAGHGAPHRERVGQGRLRPLGTPVTMP